VKSGLDSAGARSDAIGNLVHRKVLVVPQYDDRAMLRAESPERFEQRVSLRCRLTLIDGVHVCDRDLSAGMPASPQPIATGIHQDSLKPAFETRRVA
jgi:hypothetical protein